MNNQEETKANAPRDVLRDGNLKASLYRNEGAKGPFYSASLARTWRDDQGQLHDTTSFAGAELLRVSELARKAYERMGELRREDRRDVPKDRSQGQRRAAFAERRTARSARQERDR